MRRITIEESNWYRRLDTSKPGELQRATAYCLFPLGDGWEQVCYYTEPIVDRSGMAVRDPEFVYVLVNRSYPGVCKIGMTTRSVETRVKEINSATGVITPWYVAYSFRCVHSRDLENAVHSELDKRGYRVNPNREGFEVSLKEAVDLIEDLGRDYI
jgi:hypothetical protein